MPFKRLLTSSPVIGKTMEGNISLTDPLDLQLIACHCFDELKVDFSLVGGGAQRVQSENTLRWGKDHCTAGLQFN